MKRIVLVEDQDEKDQLTRFLYSSGLIERKNDGPLIIPILKIFLKEKDKPQSYEELLKKLPKGQELRSNVVKVCKKLVDHGLIESIAYTPKRKKRWERAFLFRGFKQATELQRKKAEMILNDIEKIGEKLDE